MPGKPYSKAEKQELKGSKMAKQSPLKRSQLPKPKKGKEPSRQSTDGHQ